MSGYSGWAPAKFDESALVGKASNGSEVRDGQGKGQPQSDGGGTNDSEFLYDSTSGEWQRLLPGGTCRFLQSAAVFVAESMLSECFTRHDQTARLKMPP